MNYWWFADLHLGHSNIILYENRPFIKKGDLREDGKWISKEIAIQRGKWMDEILIRNYNTRVKDGDIVYCVGDFCFRNSSGGKTGEGGKTKSIEYESRMNGKIIHCAGNHDNNNSTKTNIQGILIKYGGKQIWMTHKPQYANLNYSINFTAHVHSLWKFKSIQGKYNPDTDSYDRVDLINVGVDVWSFMPVKFNEIMKNYYRWKKGILNDSGDKK